MTEIYKKCFEDYEISNFGNCRKLLKNGEYRIIKGSVTNMGYRYFQINRKKKRKNMLFHLLVTKCFLGEKPNDKVVDHIDRNKLNNNINNLRYITQLENCRNTDRYRTDIKEKNKRLRANILTKQTRDRAIKKNNFSCDICGFKYPWKKRLTRHLEGKRHKLKVERKKLMEDQGIEWSIENYTKFRETLY